MIRASTALLPLLLAACKEEPPPVEALSPAEAEARAEALQKAAPAADPTSPPPEGAVEASTPETSTPVQPELKWVGVGSLHKGFFTNPEMIQQLSADLTGEVRSPAPIVISYDQQKHVGWLRYQADPGAFQRKLRADGPVVSLQDLAPITTALARYRSGVAGRFDLRVESFKVGIESVRPGRACIFTIAGTPPPDGRLVSPCVEINGQQHCGEPTPEGVRFAPEVAKDVRACLDLPDR